MATAVECQTLLCYSWCCLVLLLSMSARVVYHQANGMLVSPFIAKIKGVTVVGVIIFICSVGVMVGPKIAHFCEKLFDLTNTDPKETILSVQTCFVTSGVAINLAQFGLALGFTAVLLPQLRAPDSGIAIDDSSESWIAAVPGFALIIGNFTVPSIMGKFGRKIASIISIVIIIIGWVLITIANSVPLILTARFLKGISMGMVASLGAIQVGEYTSPKNRGAFLSILSLVMAGGTMTVHTVGSYLSWQKTAMLCATISVLDLIIAIFSPESPSWLAEQGRYDECRKVFRWLRGYNEDDELEKMIETDKISKQSKAGPPKPFWKETRIKLAQFSSDIKKKSFYKPILIMIHVYAIAEWGGINILSPYIIDLVNSLVNKEEIDVPALVISVDAQRIIMGIVTVFLMKKVKRRTILFSTMILCVIVMICTAGYSFAKTSNSVPFDHPSIPTILLHLHMLTVAVGSVPISMVVSGEIFPLEFRSLAGAISALFLSIHFFIVVKTFPYIFRNLGLHGAYMIYAVVITYCTVICWLFLPETKDRTLQEIEEEVTGRRLRNEDPKSAQALMS